MLTDQIPFLFFFSGTYFFTLLFISINFAYLSVKFSSLSRLNWFWISMEYYSCRSLHQENLSQSRRVRWAFLEMRRLSRMIFAETTLWSKQAELKVLCASGFKILFLHFCERVCSQVDVGYLKCDLWRAISWHTFFQTVFPASSSFSQRSLTRRHPYLLMKRKKRMSTFPNLALKSPSTTRKLWAGMSLIAD